MSWLGRRSFSGTISYHMLRSHVTLIQLTVVFACCQTCHAAPTHPPPRPHTFQRVFVLNPKNKWLFLDEKPDKSWLVRSSKSQLESCWTRTYITSKCCLFCKISNVKNISFCAHTAVIQMCRWSNSIKKCLNAFICLEVQSSRNWQLEPKHNSRYLCCKYHKGDTISKQYW